MLKYFRTVNGSTFGPDITDQNGVQKSPFNSANDKSAQIINSVVLTPSNNQFTYGGYNLLLSGTTGYVPSAFTNLETIALADRPKYFDAEGRPIAGSGCPALGLADPARRHAKLVVSPDVEGNPRVSNDAIDAGAFQSRWEAEYARKLSGRRMVCLSASSNAVEVADGVRLVSGELVLQTKADVPSTATEYLLTAEVDGTGTLNLYVDDVPAGSFAAGAVERKLTLTAGTRPVVRFEYVPGEDDEGGATIKGFRVQTGMLLLVR